MSLFYVIFAWVCTFCFLSLQLTRPHKSKQGNIQLHVSVIDNYRSGVLISPASKGRIVMAVNKKQLIINCYIWSAVITYLLSTLVCFCFINDWLIIWLAVCTYLKQCNWVNLSSSKNIHSFEYSNIYQQLFLRVIKLSWDTEPDTAQKPNTKFDLSMPHCHRPSPQCQHAMMPSTSRLI